MALGAGTAHWFIRAVPFRALGVALIDDFGWQTALVVFAALMLLIVPLSVASRSSPAIKTHMPDVDRQWFKTALAEAFGHRSYVLLVLGFFTCGFQLALTSPCIFRHIWWIAASPRRLADGSSP